MTAAREGREDAGPFPPPGAPALNCPGCNSKVADDTAICPECDYIIDKSFLAGAEEESGGDASTGVGPQPKARPSAPVPRARPAPSRSKPGARAAPAPSNDSTNVRSMDDIAKERAQRPPTRSTPAAKPAPSRATAARRAAAPVARDEDDVDSDASGGSPDPWARDSSRDGFRSPIEDPEVLLADARNFLGELEGPDRIAFWGAALVTLSCFMPWKETAADGDFLGLISLGFISFLFAIATMVFIGIRVRNVMAWVNPMLPWGAQTACSVVCLAWSLVFLKISSDTNLVPSPLGNSEMMISSPSIGCFLGILGAVVALLGSLMGLRRPTD
ncbi:MAG: hypothetical protein EOO71_04430 [Myxococcaceae bacterium]|nr:MAG: hypothetical protein EOO71_04430 [Myxococcaceae bacterium]